MSLAILMFFRGKFVSPAAAATTWVPFLLLLSFGYFFFGNFVFVYWLYSIGAPRPSPCPWHFPAARSRTSHVAAQKKIFTR